MNKYLAITLLSTASIGVIIACMLVFQAIDTNRANALSNDLEIYGWYDLHTHQIMIDTTTSQNRLRTFFHEDCHYVWYEEMTKEERNNYKQLYEQSQFPLRDTVEEDWAESCAKQKYEELKQ